jgi:hypothetical protein
MKTWSCPKKIAARTATLFTHPCPNQYWSMAGLCDGPGCELTQILDAGLIQPEQFHGVEINREIFEQNVRTFPEVAWHHGDFYTVMHDIEDFNPSLVNADLIQTVDTAAGYIARLFHLLDPFDVTLVANFIMEHRGYRAAPEHVLVRLSECQQFRYAMRGGWRFDGRCYRYPGTGHRSHTIMGTFIFRRGQP